MYAIIGATGNTGKVVAEQLLSQGHEVRAVVRDVAKAEALRTRGAEVVKADLSDEKALTEALRGVRGAYVMMPPNVETADMLVTARAQADTLAAAVKKAGVPHVVHLSSVGAQHETGTGPIVGQHYAEQQLKHAVSNVSSIRPPYFMENWASSLGALEQGQLISMLPLEQSIPMIATDDIGRIAAATLVEGPRGHEVIELLGPDSYSPHAIAQLLSKIVGRPLTATLVPEEALVPTFESFGFSARNAEIYAELFTSIARGKSVLEGTHRTVRGQVGIETVLRRLLNA